MNILPKNYSEFQSKAYWDKFFRKLKKQKDESEFFEWYGNFKDFQSILVNLLAPSSKILNIGCGNSLFSEELYDAGFQAITNCDFSEQVIADMKARSKTIRPQMVYEVMDIFKMTYLPSAFDVVLDKGLLDAVYPEESQENTVKITQFFADIANVLTKNETKSRYIIVSLLQPHVLSMILSYFSPLKFAITVYEVLIEKSTLYPFLVDIAVSETANNPIILHLKSQAESITLSPTQLKQQIARIQTQNRFMTQVKKCHASQRFSIEVWDPKNAATKVPKYTLHVVDSPSKKMLENKSCACFITPQGKEQSYFSSTEKGNFELLAQTGMSRLIIAILNPGHVFTNLKEAQDELSPAVNDLIPKGCKNLPVPFMTDGDDIGEKDVILQNEELIIEEVLNEEGHALRRLVLKNNISAIQTQFKMTYFTAKNRPDLVEQNKLQQSILAPKKNMVVGIDESYLDQEYHRAFIAGLSLIDKEVFSEKQDMNVLVLGGGLCAISRFIHNHFNNTKITTVEMSKNVVEAVKTMFGDIKDPRFKLTLDNAVSYVKNLPVNEEPKHTLDTVEEKKADEEDNESNDQGSNATSQNKSAANKKHKQFDIIIIDILSSNEDSISPPEQFLTEDFLHKIKRLLVENTGVLMINYIGMGVRDSGDFLATKASKVFDMIYSYKTSQQDLNEVLFLVNTNFRREIVIDSMNAKEERIIVDKGALKQKKELEINFKAIMKKTTKPWDFTLNIEGMCSNIALRYPLVNAGSFQKTNVFVDQGNDQLTNNTKEMYQNDLGKMIKKKSKNKKK